MKNYSMSWDILGLAEKIFENATPADSYQFFKENFSGNATSLFFDRNGQKKPRKQRSWNAVISVEAKAADGAIHTLNLDYVPDRKMYLKEFMDGINQHWLDECDRDLAGMDCISAKAVARCKAP